MGVDTLLYAAALSLHQTVGYPSPPLPPTTLYPMLESAVERIFDQRVRELGGLSFKFAPVPPSSPQCTRLRSMPLSYSVVHNLLAERLGPARTHPCSSCGDPAVDWAYQHTSPAPYINPQGYLYSEDPGDYRPMCRACHRDLDENTLRPENPILVTRSSPDRVREAGRRNTAKLQERRRTDPDLDARLSAASRATIGKAQAAHLQKLEDDPEYRARRSRISSAGAAALRARREEDPELDERIRAAQRETCRKVGTQTSRMKRKCAECDLVSNPGGVALHQKKSGHRGYEDA